MKRNEKHLQDLRNIIKRVNFCIKGITEGKERENKVNAYLKT